jgi:hypothetical protein
MNKLNGILFLFWLIGNSSPPAECGFLGSLTGEFNQQQNFLLTHPMEIY